MLRLILAVVFVCSSFSLTVSAQTDSLLKELLDSPAPPPIEAKKVEKRERPPEFFSHKNIPPDDAPIENLLDYWKREANYNPNNLDYSPAPSDETVERLLEHLEDNPELLNSYLEMLPSKPEIAEKVKQIYDKMTQNPQTAQQYSTHQTRNWLKHNSVAFVDELIKDLRNIRDENDYVSNEFQYALRSLARVDWDAAQQIADRLESDSSQPYSQTLALWTRYQRAIDAEDSGDTEKYREKLKRIVEDKRAPWAKRDLALDALVAGGDWDGRDEWYFSLLADETLLTIQDNGNTGLTTMIGAMPPGNYRERLLSLVKSDDLAVRSAAARNLIDGFAGEKEVLEALLPWLSDPDWARQSRNRERNSLIENLGEVLIPESVPALITILTNEEESRQAVAKVLAKYKDPRAVPALRAVLPEMRGAQARSTIISALAESGGFSDDEQMAALEAYAAMISTPSGEKEVQEFQYRYYEADYDSEEEAESEDDETTDIRPVAPKVKTAPEKVLPLQISIGKYVAEQTEPSDGVVTRALERLKVLKQTKPPVAATLEDIIKKWQGRTVFIEMLRRIRAGEADLDTIYLALAQRKTIREKVPNEVALLRSASGAVRGIGACLAEDELDFLGILGQQDAAAQIAMLGCARLLRVKLPIEEVGALLNNPNKMLALAAERWLESEDGVRARTLVLAKHPNETRILGARTAFVPGEKNNARSEALNALFQSVNGSYFGGQSFDSLDRFGGSLRDEAKANADLLAVYALLPNYEHGQQVVRVFKDRVTYTHYEDAARFRERNLSAKEYEEFYNFILKNNIDALKPTIENCHHGCPASEFVMFGRGGGRRVFNSSYGANESLAKLFERFEEFRTSETKLRYRLADKIKGLEVILANDKLPVRAVWKKDADFRFVVEDLAEQQENRKKVGQYFAAANENAGEDETDEQLAARYASYQKMRMESEDAHLSWRRLDGGKAGAVADQPFEAQFLYDNSQVSKFSPFDNEPRAWRVRTAAGEIRVKSAYEEDGGLYRAPLAQNPVKIRSGNYANPLVSADGKWAVVSKSTGEWSDPRTIVRVNLQTNAELKVNIAPADAFTPVAFLPTHNKFLLYRAEENYSPTGINAITTASAVAASDDDEEDPDEKKKPNPSPKTPEYYLLDAATGAAQLVKGEFRPLHQQTFRPLQPTGNPGEFWAAIYDAKTKTTDVGRYNDKTFGFQSIAKLPEIALDSMDVWVDEKENKIYFVYQGHLLSAPLKAEIGQVKKEN